MNPMRDQSGSPYGDSTPRSPFSPYSGDERHRNLADSKRDTTTPRSPFSPFSPLSGDERHKTLAESKFQQALPCSDPSSPGSMHHGGHKFHEVFQMKQGRYDLQASKISEMMKSSSLDNAPTQSLLSVVNGILDESIERKNGEIPQRVACLLRKVVQEIERRISTQAEHLRTVHHLALHRYGEGTASTGDESDPRADQFTATRTEKSSPSAPADSPTVKLIDRNHLVSISRDGFWFECKNILTDMFKKPGPGPTKFSNITFTSEIDHQRHQSPGNPNRRFARRGVLAMRFRYAMVCSSNQNRSMEAHFLLKRQGLDVASYGTGSHVKLPGPSAREPNVYDFGTPYKQMFDELRRKDPELYKRNGILQMLKRNLNVKLAPQRWQDNAADGVFDVVMTFEEKVFDSVLEGNQDSSSHVFGSLNTENTMKSLSLALEPVLRKVVRQEVEHGISKRLRSFSPSPSFCVEARESIAPTLKLMFAKNLKKPIFTGSKIIDEDNNPLQIILVNDSNNDHYIAPVNLDRPIRLDIVALHGDFPSGDKWSSDEFDRNIVKERDGKRPLLAGDVTVTVRNGVGTIGDIEFTDNSSWIRSRKFKIGVKVAKGSSGQGVAVCEAMTEAFNVRDHRGELFVHNQEEDLIHTQIEMNPQAPPHNGGFEAPGGVLQPHNLLGNEDSVTGRDLPPQFQSDQDKLLDSNILSPFSDLAFDSNTFYSGFDSYGVDDHLSWFGA
ncbi:hypothetical protein F2Q68_00045567 [Brassica cretica]|uniref:protein-serine/threonine phosphatase n=1 Tax=Brassica cretica TaxID=69181 RepID=A0A8S9LJK9_BRACR|nr:hypothetical protein F2Q68_00045567 [Brassica cretica]